MSGFQPGYRGRRRGRKVKYSKQKKMVEGHGPTFLEQLGSGFGAAAEVAKAVLPMVEMINTEVKYADQNATVTAYNPGTNDQIVCLTNAISQGSDDFNRIGNSILAKDLNVRIYASYSGADATHLTNIGRITMLCWKDNANANPPTVAKIWESATVINSPFNKDYTDQFVVLKDKIIPFNAYVAATTAQDQKIFKWYKKLDWHMRWLNTTTGNTTNHIYIIFRGAQTAVANALSFTYYTRMNFTDN